MKKILPAVALAIAIPALVSAQAATAHAPKTGQAQACPQDHSKMAGMDHSKMAGMDHSKMGSMDHSKMAAMDHSKMNMTSGAPCPAGQSAAQSGAKAPPADPPSNHKH